MTLPSVHDQALAITNLLASYTGLKAELEHLRYGDETCRIYFYAPELTPGNTPIRLCSIALRQSNQRRGDAIQKEWGVQMAHITYATPNLDALCTFQQYIDLYYQELPDRDQHDHLMAE